MGNTPQTTPAQKLQAERLTYPGLLPREIIVLRNWLKLHESEYDRFDYNVRLGDGFDPGPTFEPNIRDMAIQNTQKRVDAVGYKGSTATLIEVKDRAGFSAIGQIVGYDALWRKANPAAPEPKLLLVCNRFAPDILPVLERQGIEINVVAADFSELKG
jgi:hypothetical protein